AHRRGGGEGRRHPSRKPLHCRPFSGRTVDPRRDAVNKARLWETGGHSVTSVPTSMTAIAIREPGGPETLRPEERPVPRPGPDEVLIRVAAAGVNRPDVLQRMG